MINSMQFLLGKGGGGVDMDFAPNEIKYCYKFINFG